MPSVPGKSKWKERIAEVLSNQGALTERQIMQAIDHDTQHTRGVLRNMLKAGLVCRQRGDNNSYLYGLAIGLDELKKKAIRVPDYAKLRQRCKAIKNLFLTQGAKNPRLSEDEIMRSFGQHPRGVREALRSLAEASWLKFQEGRFVCTEVTEAERAACQSIVRLQSSYSDASEASTETESGCPSPAQGGDEMWGFEYRQLNHLHQVAGRHFGDFLEAQEAKGGQ
eukprot:CAMPEP_0206253410 /NCGR_PEP_ID=MMETSP0047_2-20121206/23135_1 /ASSEMBLY_ACC=CAM_ASM_000192 /TAXON_ID=195065 /ORGANISM="Chroomonas mesostigmatica_cf, Strain CCMP1168" /LENGTH=223 /DNA_ID=CAMNT_0053679613 /DNA_START=113 /DNA_END=784 /DNA_ORIENTATION=+